MENQMRDWPYAVLALGVSSCLVGAFLMAAGESIRRRSYGYRNYSWELLDLE